MVTINQCESTIKIACKNLLAIMVERILLVECNHDIRDRITRHLLHPLEFEVSVADDVESAIRQGSNRRRI